MTDAELEAVVAGITDAVMANVRKELAAVFTRQEALEKTLPVAGPPGPQGVPGEPGMAGKDGADGQSGKDGRDGIDGKDGAQGLNGKDGADGLIGPQGIAGRDGLPGVQGPQGEKGLDGKDGLHGKDGSDGLGFDDMTEELAEDGRTVIRRYTAGDRVKEVRHVFDVVIDRGVFQPGAEYVKGDAVTWGGSFYVAQKATSAKPGESSAESRAWRLTVKRGADGKVGPVGPAGPVGPRGEVGPVRDRF